MLNGGDFGIYYHGYIVGQAAVLRVGSGAANLRRSLEQIRFASSRIPRELVPAAHAALDRHCSWRVPQFNMKTQVRFMFLLATVVCANAQVVPVGAVG